MVDAWVTKALPSTRAVGDTVPPSNDVNLLTAALAEVQSATLIRKIDADSYYARVNVPVKLIFSDTQPSTMAADEYWFDTSGDASVPEAGYFADRATSSCATVPLGLANGALTLTSGSINAGLAINKQTKQYTSIRTHIVGQTTAATDLFLGVWGYDGTLLASTANISSTVVAGSLLSAPLTTPLNLSYGTKVFIGISVIGGSAITALRYGYGGNQTGVLNTITAVSPVRVGWLVTGNSATSASPPALTGTTGQSNFPWVELV